MSVARNAPCPCGSGKKHKKCCLAKDESARAADRVATRDSAAAGVEETETVKAGAQRGSVGRTKARAHQRPAAQTGAGQTLRRRRVGAE